MLADLSHLPVEDGAVVESSAHDLVRTFIVNDATLEVHELWTVDGDPVFARARCGWRYKTTRHTMLH